MSPGETTLLVLAGVAVVAIVLRMASPGSGESARARLEETSGIPGGVEHGEPYDEYDDDDESSVAIEESVVMTSDGWVLMPRGDAVHLVPPADAVGPPDDPARSAPDPKRAHPAAWLAGERLVPGDLIAARVVRGAPDHDPWRLEGLGRDGDYRSWRFETADAADAALALFTRSVLRPPVDRYGDPLTPEDEAFVSARLAHEATERDLASLPETEAPEEPGR